MSHQWWLDPDTLPDEEWVSYVELADRRVEILFADGDTDQFFTATEAREWLESERFLPAEEALRSGRARRLPDLPKARRWWVF